MIKTRLFKSIFISLSLVAILNFVGIQLYLYWTTWWFDMIVHFLAGVTIAMTIILFWYRFFNINEYSLHRIILITVIGAIIVGILWEFFELYFSITSLSDGIRYVRDTASDILMDTTGGFFGALYGHRFLPKQ